MPSADPARTSRRPCGSGPEQTRQFAVDVARLLDDLHCESVVLLDVRGRSDVTDFVVIASGTSSRQIKSIGGDVQQLARETGMERFGREEDGQGSWLVIDFIDVVVHLFDPVTRAYYDLEMMWGDAPGVHWQRT